jgi:aspartate/methionine/tyrosine aminotransferase
MQYKRMPIEVESPEEMGYGTIKNNLAESSVRDRKFSELGANMDELILNYGDHRGLPDLRKLICENSPIINIEQVLVTQAAAMALFIINTTLLSANDHIIVIRPNYATNIETPRAIGCEISFVELTFENSYSVDIEKFKEAIQPNTKLISLTNPHNPTGVIIDENTILQLAEIAAKHECYLLVDETYRELNFQTELMPYFAEKSKNIISVSSISKAYGLPGLRIGWIICQDKVLMNQFLAAKEQIIICNSVVDEYLAFCALHNKVKLLEQSHLVLKENFEITKKWIQNHEYLEWIAPTAGAVCFPRFKANINIDFSLFYQKLFENFQTIVGPGHWFEQTDSSFRLGFGFPTKHELIEGLKAIDQTIELIIK